MSVPVREMLRIHIHFDQGFEGATVWLPESWTGNALVRGEEEKLSGPGELRRLLGAFRVDALLYGGPGMPFQPIAEIRRSSPDEVVEFVSERFRRESDVRAKLRSGAPVTADDEQFRHRLSDLMVLSTTTSRSQAPEFLELFRRSHGRPPARGRPAPFMEA